VTAVFVTNTYTAVDLPGK